MGAYGRVHPYQFFPAQERKRVKEVLDQVGLPHVSGEIFLFALSGGQKQRDADRACVDGEPEDHDSR